MWTCPTDMVREKRGAVKISFVACIGCGRCVNVCHGGVGMPAVVEIIRRTNAEKEQQ